MVAEGLVAEHTGEWSAHMPRDVPEGLEPPPQSVADVEGSQYGTA